MTPTINPACWWMLGFGLWCAWFTWNAFLPIRRRREFILGSFLAGWWTSEMPVHHLAWQLIVAWVLVDLGALDAWPGVLGMAINVVSWVGLVALAIGGARAEQVFERTLRAELGEDYVERLPPEVRERGRLPEPRARLVVPWYFGDRRVHVHAGIQYAPGAGRRHQLDVHAPVVGAQRAPVLFHVHGGGWVVGNKSQQGRPLLAYMAARGWVCVSANYRLSPRATFPDHLIDLKQALAWTRAHIAEYGGDPNFIVVTGGSAGGHLSSLLALTANDPRYQPGFEDVDTRVAACVPFYGVYDFRDRSRVHKHRGLALVVNRLVMKSSPRKNPDAFDEASPIARIHPDAPPFFIVHGDSDSMAPHEEARVFAQKLRETSKAKTVYVELPGTQHAFEVFHSVRTAHSSAAVFKFLSMIHAEYLANRAEHKAHDHA